MARQVGKQGLLTIYDSLAIVPRLKAAHYLDTYFNLDRRHSALGYRSPHQVERT